MKTSTMKKVLIGLVAALCLTAVLGVTAFALYTNYVTNKTNTITIGQTVDTVVLGDGNDVSGPMYPGDTATITYEVQLENHTGDVTVSWELTPNAGTIGENDFTVTVTTGAESVSVTEGETPVQAGSLVFTIKMNESVTEVPEYSSITLSVTLNTEAA